MNLFNNLELSVFSLTETQVQGMYTITYGWFNIKVLWHYVSVIFNYSTCIWAIFYISLIITYLYVELAICIRQAKFSVVLEALKMLNIHQGNSTRWLYNILKIVMNLCLQHILSCKG